MKHYDSIPRIQDDGALMGDMVWGYNKLDGQNFVAAYNCRKKTWGPFGSRTVTVDENSEQFGVVVKWFKNSHYPETLSHIVQANSGKKQLFTGVEEVTFVFEWYSEKSFAGKHEEGDEMHLALIDVFLKKKGYIEPKEYEMFFRGAVEMPNLIYIGPLDAEIISKVQNNDWTQEGCETLGYIVADDVKVTSVKEGVVFKRSTLMKGQRRPSVKVKTKWWLEKLHSMYSEEECKKLE